MSMTVVRRTKKGGKNKSCVYEKIVFVLQEPVGLEIIHDREKQEEKEENSSTLHQPFPFLISNQKPVRMETSDFTIFCFCDFAIL